MKTLMYRVNNYRWKDGYLQKLGLFLWVNVCPCSNWLDAVWFINRKAGFMESSE